MLNIYAGKTALKKIQQEGFSPHLFTNMLGASGGPKWFTLFGLDKYLFGEFFKDKNQELNLIGSSAGSFRFAALSQNDPVAAITRLAKVYSETVYSTKANALEVSNKAIELIETVYGDDGMNECLTNPIVKPHFIVTKCHGLTTFEQKVPQFLGLLTSIGLNRISRNLLRHQYQRVIFHHENSQVKLIDTCHFNTSYQALTKENFKLALLASGSIPMVMQGVKNIPGSPKGMYRDGGIIDYHFDLDIQPHSGLTLYPHFNRFPKAGWFDKNLNRTINKAYYDNVVMLVPSQKFINLLPYKKIPDRTDFTEMDAQVRIKYWKNALKETERLADHFHQFLEDLDYSQIIPI